MKILFDQNIPWGLRKLLSSHSVTRARALGWGQLQNGELLLAAEKAGFELFITGDQNIRYQQSLARRRIAILELGTIHWPSLQHCKPEIIDSVDEMKPGGYRVLKCLDIRQMKTQPEMKP